MKLYACLWVTALIVSIQTTPLLLKNKTKNNTRSSSGNVQNDASNTDGAGRLHSFKKYHSDTRKMTRYSQKAANGTTHRLRVAGIDYRQQSRGDQCFVNYDGKLLAENHVLKVRTKFYRVENCLLERVYHACGPNLLLMMKLVCRLVEQNQAIPISLDLRRRSLGRERKVNHSPPRAKKTPGVITESCCENRCTISEVTRYCHR